MVYTLRTFILIFLSSLLLTACSHHYEASPETTLPFHEHYVIDRILAYRNGTADDNKAIYTTLKTSGYFPKLYRSTAGEYPPPDFSIAIFIGENKGERNAIQTLSSVGTLLTLGAAPSYNSRDYTVILRLYQKNKSVRVYRQTIEKNSTFVAWNSIKPSHASITKAVLPFFMKALHTDIISLASSSTSMPSYPVEDTPYHAQKPAPASKPKPPSAAVPSTPSYDILLHR